MLEGGQPIGEYDADAAAFEATRNDGQARVRVYRPDGLQLVLGRASRPEQELFGQACLADSVEVVRRRGGGCSVLLDPGNLIVAICLRAPGIGENRRWFERINRCLIGALGDLGIPGLAQAGISDLVLGDRKVAGCSLHRWRDTLYYAASLLVDPRIDLMERYLRHPPREPDYRRGRDHAQFVIGLAARFAPIDSDVLRAGLASKLAGRIGDL